MNEIHSDVIDRLEGTEIFNDETMNDIGIGDKIFSVSSLNDILESGDDTNENTKVEIKKLYDRIESYDYLMIIIN